MKIDRSLGAALVGCALIVGCGSQPPGQLLEARAAFKETAAGPARENAPADVHTAEVALAKAEQEYDDEGNTAETRDLAYIALRRAEIADARAQQVIAGNRQEKAGEDLKTAQAEAVTEAEKEAARSREALANEQRLREEAERLTAQAMADLAKFAAVKQEARGLVISLSGSVLYASGRSTLLPAARERLDEVAAALKQQPDSKIIVEGHTDSAGSDDSNMELSRARATAIVEYLASRGIERDRMEAVGLGESRPATENNTAEGRANNRRVEIIVAPSPAPVTVNTP